MTNNTPAAVIGGDRHIYVIYVHVYIHTGLVPSFTIYCSNLNFSYCIQVSTYRRYTEKRGLVGYRSMETPGIYERDSSLTN